MIRWLLTKLCPDCIDRTDVEPVIWSAQVATRWLRLQESAARREVGETGYANPLEEALAPRRAMPRAPSREARDERA